MKRRIVIAGMFLAQVIAGCATSFHLNVRTVKVALEDLDRAVFVQGMNGCENLIVDNDSLRIYVSDLDGYVHLVDGDSREHLRVVRSMQVAEEYALGIDRGPDGFLYVGASGKDWLKTGGAVYRLDRGLEKSEKLTAEFPGLNGLVFDGSGNLYFASGKMSILSRRGAIYRMEISPAGGHARPEIFLADRKNPNGLFYSGKENRVVFTEMLTGVSRFDPETGEVEKILGKTRVLEAYDDVCMDRDGTYWVTDPPGGFIKRYNPNEGELTRYIVEGVGQTSACGVREENGEQILYVTELKQSRGKPLSQKFDGRGVVGIPVRELLKAGGVSSE